MFEPVPALWPQVRWMVGLGRPYRARITAALLLTVISAGVGVLFPVGMKALVDSVLVAGGARARLDKIALALLALFAVQTGAGFAGRYWLTQSGERIVADLRNRLYRHVHHLDLPYFASTSVGTITSRLISDVGSVRAASTGSLVTAVRVAFTLLGSVAFMVALNPVLATVVMAATPLSTLVSRRIGRVLRSLSSRVQDRLADANALAEEALGAVRVVKAFGQSNREADRYAAEVEGVYEISRQAGRHAAAMNASVGFLFYTALVVVVWVGGREVLAGRSTAGDLVAFVLYAMTVTQALNEASGLYATYNSAAGASSRLRDILRRTPAVCRRTNPSHAPEQATLEADRVRYSYADGAPVLDGVSFALVPGETVALVGASGAGKTTLLHLLIGFYALQGGRVSVGGVNVRGLEPNALRESVGLVDQQVQLFADTVRDNVRYGRPDATEAEVVAAAVAADADAFIRHLPEGYDTRLGPRGARLSGGQQQRIAIARALVVDPLVLLLDEATAALDVETSAAVLAGIRRVRAARTTLISTHRLSTAQAADRVLVLDRGHLVEAGPHHRLIQQQGVYARMVATHEGLTDDVPRSGVDSS